MRQIYIVRASEETVKIGISNKPLRRLSGIQNGSALPLTLHYCAKVIGDAAAVERRAHEILARHRLVGEWFAAPPEVAVAAVMQSASDLGLILGDPTRQLPLSGRLDRNEGLFALVDEIDFERLAIFRWYARRAPRSLTIYARRKLPSRDSNAGQSLHQVVLGVRAGCEIRFLNGDGLDCRRSNLRHGSHRETVTASVRRLKCDPFDVWAAEQMARLDAE